MRRPELEGKVVIQRKTADLARSAAANRVDATIAPRTEDRSDNENSRDSRQNQPVGLMTFSAKGLIFAREYGIVHRVRARREIDEMQFGQQHLRIAPAMVAALALACAGAFAIVRSAPASADQIKALIEQTDAANHEEKSDDGALPAFVPNRHVLSTDGIGGPTAPTETKPQRQIKFEPIVPPAPATPPAESQAPPPTPRIAAKTLFGAAKVPAPLAPRVIGNYSLGCLAGAERMPDDGPTWQAMRLSRNRHWAHPSLVALVEQLSSDAKKLDGWPGLLLGDMSQPRGGPMLSGHASHQVGLDADIWLTPMPDRKLTGREREDISATSMLDKTDLAVDPKVFTDKHVALLKRAASYPQVERILVHPAIKKALCIAAGSDRRWLGKVRPIGGHYYHFHIRISCPAGSPLCKPQKPPTGEDGCGKEVDEWLARLAPRKGPPPPKPPGYKPKPPKPPIWMAQLPHQCALVLEKGPNGIAIPKDAWPAPKSAVATHAHDATRSHSAAAKKP